MFGDIDGVHSIDSTDTRQGQVTGQTRTRPNRASTSDLGEIALASSPLTSATSLVDLLAPDVQHYILHHGASTRVAAVIPGSELASAPFLGRKSSRRTHPHAAGHSPSHSHSQSVSASPAASASASAAAISGSPPRPPRRPRPIAAIADEYLQQAAYESKTKETGSKSMSSSSSSSLSKLLQPPSSTVSRGARVKAKEAAALLHRPHAEPTAHTNTLSTEATHEAPAVTPAGDADAQPKPAPAYDGLFHSQSRDLLAGMDIPSLHVGSSSFDDLSSRRGSSRKDKAYQGLNGLSYSLTHAHASTASLLSTDHGPSAPAPNKFVLPHTEVLDATDGFTGLVDRWPARAHERAPRTLYSSHALRDLDVSSSNAKPKFLIDLEIHVKNELRLLGLSDHDQPTSSRLQVYRELFLKFIEDFQTYKPILSRILREYDDFITQLSLKLDVIPILQCKLGTIEEDTKLRLSLLQEEWLKQQCEWEEKCKSFEQRIKLDQEEMEQLRQQHLQTQNELMTLTTNHQALVVSNSTLKRALTRYGTEKNAAWDEKIMEIDLNRRLNSQIVDMQKQQDALIQEMNLLRTHATSISTMNPQEYQRLKNENIELKTELTSLTDKYDQRCLEYSTLLNLYESSNEERKKMVHEKEMYERMKHSSTPRPQWRRVNTHSNTHNPPHTRRIHTG